MLGNPSSLPVTPTPIANESSQPAPEATFARPGVTQPTVVQPPGISGYLPPDILLPIVFAVLVVITAGKPAAVNAVRALISLFKGTGSPPAP